MDEISDDDLPFSVREGIVPRKAIQWQSMDDALRTALWNTLSLYFWKNLPYYMGEPNNLQKKPQMQSRILFEFVWMFVLDRAIEDIPDRSERALPELRAAYQGLPWYRVYDLIEYIGQRDANLVNYTQFRGTCNDVFRKYSSAYRFVSGLIVPVTSEAEISAVEGA
jgi:hypothetical protein